ncbi:MAG TPA: DUF3224 domain-containing protein [Pyrinomonadaceae bacterium]
MRDHLNSFRWTILLLVVSSIAVSVGLVLGGSHPLNGPHQQKEGRVTNRASGTFEVKLAPQDDKTGQAGLGRMIIDKQLQGDFVGTSKGQMLTAMTNVEGSAGYVAIERLTGTLKGRKGSFVLQHNGTMNRSAQQLNITVVPDSGTEELTGLAGVMKIKIEGGKHFYEFEYTLPE